MNVFRSSSTFYLRDFGSQSALLGVQAIWNTDVCVCVCVCVCIYMYVCMYGCMCVCIMPVYACVCMYVC